jgi:hypothetical protein
LSDFESRFSTQIVEQEGIFESSQTDKENRFQQFLVSSGYVFLGITKMAHSSLALVTSTSAITTSITA